MAVRGNYITLGDDHYSYETCIRTTLSNGLTVGNVTKYSVTTSRHQSYAGSRTCDVLVDNVPRGTSAAKLQELGALQALKERKVPVA